MPSYLRLPPQPRTAKKGKPRPPGKPTGGIVGTVPPGISPLGWPNVYPPGTIQNTRLDMHPLTAVLLRAGMLR